jgi:endonuclease YncB( thermonuclease family)
LHGKDREERMRRAIINNNIDIVKELIDNGMLVIVIKRVHCQVYVVLLLYRF